VNNFIFLNPTRIIFGKGTENLVGAETKKHADKVLLHYGGGSIKKIGLYDTVVKSLKEAGVEFTELAGVQPNPRLSLVRQGIEICRKEGIRFILAVGGGSAIDSAKAIAVGVPYDGDVWDFYIGKAKVKEALPVGVVLTIPAAGSEASPSSVITNEDGWYKRGLTTDRIFPRFSILNPELTYTLPNYQTACGAADIMAHIMERYFTNTKDVELTDRLCESTMKTLINNVPKALANPTDYAARAEIMWTATVAHNNLLGTGRDEDWASHDIEHEISGIYDIAHGAGLAIVFPVVIGVVLGSGGLAGMLVGSIATGVMLGIQMANSGGAMDNAKKYIEEGHFGGKGSDAHKAAVVGDTVGDPLKDTVGPSINILIKLMCVIALVLAPLFARITPLFDLLLVK